MVCSGVAGFFGPCVCRSYSFTCWRTLALFGFHSTRRVLIMNRTGKKQNQHTQQASCKQSCNGSQDRVTGCAAAQKQTAFVLSHKTACTAAFAICASELGPWTTSSCDSRPDEPSSVVQVQLQGHPRSCFGRDEANTMTINVGHVHVRQQRRNLQIANGRPFNVASK